MMYPRTEYEMTEEQMKVLMDACKPVPCIMVGGYSPQTPQQNANNAWAKLGEEMGFDSTTVQPVSGKGTAFFTAVPSETEEQRVDRVHKEQQLKATARRKEIMDQIEELNTELAAMR